MKSIFNDAVIYTRISTSAQVAQGINFEFQEIKCKSHCELHRYNLLKVFQEGYSGKDFDRTAWKELIEFIKVNREKPLKLVIMSLDRLSRDKRQAVEKIHQLNELGVELDFVEKSAIS